MRREEVSFVSSGEQIAAWVYGPHPVGPGPSRPGSSQRAGAAGQTPVVVMAHGLGGVREAGLEPYAERFAAAGMRVVVFDYRHFGGSTGEPRQLIDIGRQLDDWRAAVAFARDLDGVDPERVAIWGTSFGGGHVITIAAEDARIAAAIAQAPMADGVATLRAFGPAGCLRRAGLGMRDELARIRGREPVYSPLTGPPGSAAALVADDAEAGYARVVPAVTTWQNRYAARLNLRVAPYRPVRVAERVACPLLVCVCDEDHVTPPGPAVRAAERASRGEAIHYDGRHFDIYVGELFERAVADQTAFLERHLAIVSDA